MTEEQLGFNWKYLFETEESVADFLSGEGSLWGGNQGYENQGRQRYYQYVANLPENSNILEVGFAQGLDREYLRKENQLTNKTYTGLDITESFVKYANNKLNWINAYKYDGLIIPYVNNYFDYSYLRHVFEHQNHYAALLKEVFRVTKNEIFINFFIPPEDNAEDKIEFDGYFYHNLYSRPKLKKFIQEYGWSVKEEQIFKTSNYTDNIWVLSKND